MDAIADGRAMCAQSHPYVCIFGAQYEWFADKCVFQGMPFEPSYHCDPCGYDMCAACVRESMDASSPPPVPFPFAALRVLKIARTDVYPRFLQRVLNGATELDDLDCDDQHDTSAVVARVRRHLLLTAAAERVVLSALVAQTVKVQHALPTLKGQSSSATALVLELDKTATRVLFSQDDFPNLASITLKMAAYDCLTTVVELPDTLRRLSVEYGTCLLPPQLEWLSLDTVASTQTLPFGMPHLRHLELHSARRHTHDGLHRSLAQLVESLPVLQHLTVDLGEVELADLAAVIMLEKLTSLEFHLYKADVTTESFCRALLAVDPSCAVRKPLRLSTKSFSFDPGVSAAVDLACVVDV